MLNLKLSNMKRQTLSDTQIGLDLHGHAGQIAKLLGALDAAALPNNMPLVAEVIARSMGASARQAWYSCWEARPRRRRCRSLSKLLI